MPFTLSHPAIVLPINKYGSTTALIFGSMIPDMAGFFSVGLQKAFSHSLTGVFFFDLPAGLLACFLFHLVVRNVLIDNLPQFLKERFDPFKSFNWMYYIKSHFVKVIFSLLAGIASHLALDGLTHENDFIASNQRTYFVGSNYSLFDVNQFFFSVVGLIYISYRTLQLPRTKPDFVKPIDLKYWLILILSMVLITGIIVYLNNPFQVNITTVSNLILAGITLGLLVSSLFSKKNLFEAKN